MNFSKVVSLSHHLFFFFFLFIIQSIHAQNSAILWQKDYSDSLMCSRDEIVDAAIDYDGKLVVTGNTERSVSNFDITTLKIDKDGSTVWKNVFSSNPVTSNSLDQTKCMQIDKLGNKYIYGFEIKPGTYQTFFLVKCNNAGQKQWTINNPIDIYDVQPKDMVLDKYGNIYLTALSNSNTYLYKYSTDGVLCWTKKLKTFPQSLSVDSLGNLFFLGKNAGSDQMFQVIKFNESGTILLNLDTISSIRRATDVQLISDSSGCFYISGLIRNYDPVALKTRSNIFFRKYSANGNLLWNNFYKPANSVSIDQDHLVGIRKNQLNQFWIGYNFNIEDVGLNFFFTCVDATGKTIHDFSYNGKWNDNDYLNDFVLDSDNNLLVTGILFQDTNTSYTYLMQFDFSGTVAWESEISDQNYIEYFPVKLLQDADKDIYVCSNFCNTKNPLLSYYTDIDYAILKFASSGKKIWERTYTDIGTSYLNAQFVSVDRNNGVYVGGTSQKGPAMEYPEYYDNRDFLFVKYDENGQLQWSRRYNSAAFAEDRLVTMFSTSSDDLVAVGITLSSLKQAILLKYNKDGTLVSEKLAYSLGILINAYTDAFRKDVFYTVSYISNRQFISKLNENFEVLWTRPLSDVMYVTTDENGNVYTCGQQSISKLDINGNIKWTQNFETYDYLYDFKYKKGRLYFTGGWRNNSSNWNAKTSCFDVNGNFMWSDLFYDSENGQIIWPQTDGDVFVFARSRNYGASYLLKYHSSGTRYETLKLGFNITGSRVDTANNMYIIENNKIYKFNENGIYQFSRCYSNDSIEVNYKISDITLINGHIVTTGNIGNEVFLHSHKWYSYNTICFSQESAPNHSPKILEIPPQYIDNNFSYFVKATDPDNDPIILSISGVPKGITMTENGYMRLEYYWSELRGNYSVTLQAADAHGGTDSIHYNLQVGPNHLPEIYSKPDTVIRAGQPYKYAVYAGDRDNDSIYYKISTTSPWLSIDRKTGVVSGIPPLTEAGTTIDVKVIVAENLFSQEVSQSYHLKINEPNHPPIFTSMPDSVAHLYKTYRSSFQVYDKDSDEIKFQVLNKPDWLNFDKLTNELYGIPPREAFNQLNNVQIIATDTYGSTDILNFNIIVDYPENLPPVIISQPILQGFNTFLYSYPIDASDENIAGLTYQLNGPQWLKINTDGVINGRPELKDTGNYQIKIIVTDEYGKTADQQYNLRIDPTIEANSEPVQYRISPNPTYDGLIKFEVQSITKIQIDIDIIDPLGKQILTKKMSGIIGYYTCNFNLSSFSRGIYYFRINQNGMKTIKRISVLNNRY